MSGMDITLETRTFPTGRYVFMVTTDVEVGTISMRSTDLVTSYERVTDMLYDLRDFHDQLRHMVSCGEGEFVNDDLHISCWFLDNGSFHFTLDSPDLYITGDDFTADDARELYKAVHELLYGE